MIKGAILMKNALRTILFSVFCISLASAAAHAADFYVAPSGSDANPGTAVKPFASLTKARDAIRQLKAGAPLREAVTVFVHGGIYELPSGLHLDARDSGSAAAPITWRACPNETPILVGGRTITGFTPYQGKILKADVGAQGFKGITFRQLIFDGKRQHLARYPNFDESNPYGGGWAYADGKLIPAQQELAITYLKLGQRDKAEATLTKLKSLDGDCNATCKDAEQIKKAISAVEAALGQPTQAQLSTDPPFLFASAKAGDTAYLRAVGLINEKKYQEAIDELQRARTTFGAHPDILTYLGFANRKLRRYDIAENYYRQALSAAPNHKGATEYYGELLVERGDMVGAKRMLAKLENLCTFGCAETEELRRWIDAGHDPHR
jgi:hypothetical protein